MTLGELPVAPEVIAAVTKLQNDKELKHWAQSALERIYEKEKSSSPNDPVPAEQF